jgi:ribosome biogenesis GTPase
VLDRYGWSDALRLEFNLHARDGLAPARVLVQQRGLYEVATETGERSASVAGRLAHDAAEGGLPVAGDWVAVALPQGDGAAQIRAVLPRRSSFIRKAAGPGAPRGQVVAANADVALLVTSLNGDLNLRRIERYLAAAWESGAQPVIVLTKADACEDAAARAAEVESIAFGVPVHAISALTGQGLDEVRAHLKPGATAVVLGSSGVGKSTLVNALAGAPLMETRAISADGQRGRHTTTHRELLVLPFGALILDTPGMRELGLWDAESGVSSAFPEIDALIAQCRFHDCRHRSEPGCALRAAREDGTLPEARWEAWRKLQKELRFEHNKENWQARQETRKVWIARQKNYRALKKHRESDEY